MVLAKVRASMPLLQFLAKTPAGKVQERGNEHGFSPPKGGAQSQEIKGGKPKGKGKHGKNGKAKDGKNGPKGSTLGKGKESTRGKGKAKNKCSWWKKW